MRSNYDFDLPEHKVLLLDWSHRTSLDLFAAQFFAGENYLPSSILVNGKAQFAIYMNQTATDYPNDYLTPREVFEVVQVLFLNEYPK